MSHRGTCTDLAWSTVTVGTSRIDSQIHDSDMHAIFFSTEQGFILVYSIASRSTFDRLEIFCKSMQREKWWDTVFMLVANKCDMTQEREVPKEEGAALARQFGCKFIETSAKMAQNVERLFMNFVRLLQRTCSKERGALALSIKETKLKLKCVVM
jgi:GTPase KRas protein